MAGLDAALAGAVKFLERDFMMDTVRVVRPALAAPVLNTTTGELEYPDAALVYEGPGAVQGGNMQAQFSAITTAGQPWVPETKSPYRLFTPLSAPIPAKDDVVTVTEVHDPNRSAALLGRSWTCDDPGRAGTVEVLRITPIDETRAPQVAP